MTGKKVVADFKEYGEVELGGRYRSSELDVAAAETDLTELHRQLAEQGYVIVEAVIPTERCEALKHEALTAFEHGAGRNNFEGFQTQRLYALFEKTLSCNPWIEHPLALALIEAVLEPLPLLSQAQIINILPGEAAQPWHFDDGFYPLPRPRAALGAATIFALDEFTADNGATVVLPGSHRWDDHAPTAAEQQQAIKATMPQGSMLLFLGTLWHHAGANHSPAARMCLTAQYCVPWCRQQENYALSVSRATARRCSPRIRQLLGYSIHKPFMGMVNGMHPLRLLE